MKSSRLVQDTRGAVMLTGLFMSTFLIGSLWFVMGVGDAIVFRDKMQEATDHGVFSASALHAKGMNFISLCNLVMLVGTIIHIILGIISDVKFAIAVACALKVLCWPALPGKVASFWKAYKRWDKYFSKMSKGFKAIHKAQKIASYAYPAMGALEAYQTGTKYGNDKYAGPVRVIALSTSLIPGGGLNGAGGGSSGTATQVGGPMGGISENSDDWKDRDFSNITLSVQGGAPNNNGAGKEGLPVQTKPFSELCTKVITVSTNGLVNLLGFGKSLGGGIGGKALKIFNGIVGGLLKARYCNSIDAHFPPLGPGFDGFWGEDGPYVVYGPAKNGNMWFQTWGLNVAASHKDTSESRVAIAKSKMSLIPAKYQKDETGKMYFAQSEFYFDCDSKWDTAACNFEDNATFAIKWRARLVRFDLGTVLSGVLGGALEALTNLASYSQFKDVKIPQAISQWVGGYFTQQMLNGAIQSVVSQLEGWVKDQIGGAIIPGGRTPTLGGIYH